MKRVYLDASAFVKAFATETASDHVNQLFQIANERRIEMVMSIWGFNESLAAVDRKFRKGEYTPQQRAFRISKMIQRVRTWEREKSNIRVVQLEPEITRRSIEFILRFHISADDAAHLYTAFIEKCDYFVYKDGKLKKYVGDKIPGLKIVALDDAAAIDEMLDSFDK